MPFDAGYLDQLMERIRKCNYDNIPDFVSQKIINKLPRP